MADGDRHVVDVFRPLSILEKQYNEKMSLPELNIDEDKMHKDALRKFTPTAYVAGYNEKERILRKINELTHIIELYDAQRDKNMKKNIQREIDRLKKLDVTAYLLDMQVLDDAIYAEDKSIQRKLYEFFKKTITDPSPLNMKYRKYYELERTFGDVVPLVDYAAVLRRMDQRGYLSKFEIIY